MCNDAMVSNLVPATFQCPACGFFASKLPVCINAVQRIDEDTRERALKGIRPSYFEHLPEVNARAHILPDYPEPGGAVIVNFPVADGLIFRMARLAAPIRRERSP